MTIINHVHSSASDDWICNHPEPQQQQIQIQKQHQRCRWGHWCSSSGWLFVLWHKTIKRTASTATPASAIVHITICNFQQLCSTAHVDAHQHPYVLYSLHCTGQAMHSMIAISPVACPTHSCPPIWCVAFSVLPLECAVHRHIHGILHALISCEMETRSLNSATSCLMPQLKCNWDQFVNKFHLIRSRNRDLFINDKRMHWTLNVLNCYATATASVPGGSGGVIVIVVVALQVTSAVGGGGGSSCSMLGTQL